MHCHTAKQMRATLISEKANLRRAAYKATGKEHLPSTQKARAVIPDLKAYIEEVKVSLESHEQTCSDCEKERREKNGRDSTPLEMS